MTPVLRKYDNTANFAGKRSKRMKFGGNICRKWATPGEWAALAKEMGYSAVYFPLNYLAEQSEIDAYCAAAKEAGLTIAEVGVWNNTLAPDTQERNAAIEKAIGQLQLADYVGANCCCNIAGSYSTQWDGPHRDNLTEKAFDEIVATTQRIIDAAKPQKTFYTLEPMPWMYPDDAQSCLKLINAVDRKGFAAHIDIVNVICSPQRYYRNADVIREWFSLLGDKIKSIHAKDITLSGKLTVHLSECRPGTGELDYRTYIECANALPEGVSFMLEHMTEEDDYVQATAFIKKTASEMGIEL